MKNKRFKKVLSVFLSVLMLMSCWVFVAPETEALADTSSLDAAISAYETKMNGTIYTNMKAAYEAYIDALEARDAYKYGGNTSIDIAAAATNLTNATNAMGTWSGTSYTQATPSFDGDNGSYTLGTTHQNILYTETVATNQKYTYTVGNLASALTNPKTVLVIDGVNTPKMPINYVGRADRNKNRYIYKLYPSNGTGVSSTYSATESSYFQMAEAWRGQGTTNDFAWIWSNGTNRGGWGPDNQQQSGKINQKTWTGGGDFSYYSGVMQVKASGFNNIATKIFVPYSGTGYSEVTGDESLQFYLLAGDSASDNNSLTISHGIAVVNYTYLQEQIKAAIGTGFSATPSYTQDYTDVLALFEAVERAQRFRIHHNSSGKTAAGVSTESALTQGYNYASVNAAVSAVATDMNTLINEFKTALGEVNADEVGYSNLRSEITTSEAIVAAGGAKYTDATWSTFSTAYNNAKSLMSATQNKNYAENGTAQTRYEALKAAREALTYITITYKYYDGTVAKTLSGSDKTAYIGMTAAELASAAPANTSIESVDDTNHYVYSWPTFSNVTDSATYQETRGTQAHQLGDYIIDQDSTCTAVGSKHKECANCDYKTATETIPVKAHTPGAAATCTAPQTCTVCGTELEAAKGHTPGAEATCTAPQTCTVCGEVLAAQLAHTEVAIPAVPATCTTPGKTEGKKCSICGTIIVAQQDTALAAHTEEVVTGKPASCTETGLTDGKKCSVCGVITVAQQTTNKKAHSMGDWSQTKDPTCITAGQKIRNCANCTYTETEEVPATGTHVYGNWAQYGDKHRRVCTADSACTAAEEEAHNFNGAPRQIDGGNYHDYKCEKCEAYGVGTTLNEREACFGEGTTFAQIDGNAAQHKEICKCDREKNDAHAYGAWEADSEDMTKMSRICSECGYEIFDETAPVITFLENGKDETFCKTVTVTITDETKVKFTVTKDSEVVQSADDYIDNKTEFTLLEAGKYVITATDASGNTATETVTVNADHTVDSWTKVDDSTHSGTCTICGETVTAEHTFTNPELARPADNDKDGVWENGTYTYTCVCGAKKTEPAVRADYSELEKAVEALEGINDDKNLSDDEKTAINNAIAEGKGITQNLVTAEQDQIDALVKKLDKIKADADKAIENAQLGVKDITEATSGVRVQFVEADGFGEVDSVQIGKDEGFIIRVTNNNADSNITVTGVAGDTEDVTLAPGESADYVVTTPTEAGIKTYEITYKIDGLKNADGTPVTATTKAYIYVKDEKYTPEHIMDEDCANGSATAEWIYTLEAAVGDFAPVYENKAPYADFGNTNLKREKALGLSVYNYYDYEDSECYAEPDEDKGSVHKGDAHAATYRYYIDTSLASTWEKAMFKANFAETLKSNYDNATLKYIRLANNEAYLKAVGEDKTFSVILKPGESSNVPTHTWTTSSVGDEALTVSHYDNSNENDYIFSQHLTDDTNLSVAYSSFYGEIPKNTESAKMMFSHRLEYNKAREAWQIGAQAEATTMTTHLYITSYDKGALRSAVEAAETAGYNSAYFNAEKYEAYENALKTAKEVLGKAETNQGEIDAAVAALNTAIADLTKAENKAKFVLTVTHSIHENADKNSEATSTLTDYYLVNGEITPALDEATTNLTTINKYDAPAKLNITADAEHTYNYWYIDYSGVQDAIAEAQNIIDNADKYDPDFVTAVTNAKNALEVIKNGESATTTPESQDDVDNAIKGVTDLTGHGCADKDIDHDCDICGATIGTHEDVDPEDHNCDYCGGKITDCADTDKNHKCDICGATMGTHADSATDSDHVCDYGCGVTLENCTDVDTDTDHNCDICGAENVTSHNYVNPVLTRPTKNEDGTWKKGYYTSTCNCGATKTETAARADYEAYDEAKAALKALLNDTTITGTAKAEIEAVLEANKIADNYIATEEEQAIVDAAAAALKAELDKLTDEEGKLEDEYKKPDYTKWEEAETAYDALDMTNVKSDIIAEAEGLKKQIADKQADDSLTQATATQTEINNATARLNQIIAGINNGTMKNPDYSDAENAIQNAKNTADSENIPDNKELEIEAEIAELERQLEELKNTNPDSTNAEANEKIEEIKGKAEAIVNKYVDCVAGTHNYADATCTSPKTCKECGVTDGEANGHDWGEGWKLTLAPTKETEGTYTRVCTKGDATETKSVAREDYSAYDEAIKKAEELLKKDELTQAAKDLIEAAITEAKKLEQNLPEDVVENGETIIDNDSAEKIAEATKVITDAIASLYDENGNLKKEYEKVDYTNYNAAVNAAKALENVMTPEDKAAVEAAKKTVTDAGITEETTKADGQKTLDDAAAAIAAINAKYGDCVNSNHTWGTPVLTKKPTATEQGEYTETCGICGTTQITKVDLANYQEFDAVVEQLEALANTKNLTNAAAEAIADALTEAEELNKNLPADATTADGKLIKGGQEEINALVEELKKVVADTNAAITSGSALKPDYKAWEEAEAAYDALDKTNVKSEIITEANNLKEQIAAKQAVTSHTQATATQKDINDATTRLNQIIAGINNGTMKTPDYSGVENAIQSAKDTADDEDIPDSKEAEIEAAIAEFERLLEELKETNPDSTDTEALAKIEEIKKAAEDIVETYKNCAKGNHTDAMGDDNHNCDTCGKADVTEHDYADATCTAPKTCNECGATDGSALEHADSDNDHICNNGCGNKISDCTDTDKNHNCDICGTELSECDDKNNDHNCDVCGDKLSDCSDVETDTDHDCDICGAKNITEHNYVDPELTRPTQKADGTWSDGYYTSTCNCGATKTETAARADYEAYDEAKAALKALLNDTTITGTAKAEIEKILADNEIEDNRVSAEQSIVDAAANALKAELEKLTNEDGSLKDEYKKPDAECTHTDCAEKVVAPTCHSLGYTLHVCKNCGYAYRTDEQPATDDHKWGRWFETESGSCLEYRMHERSCLNEGCHEKQIEIMRDANGDALYGKHYVVVIKGQAATCVAPGYTDYERCVVCGEITEAEVIPATGHIDNNKNGNCDVCNYVTNPSIGKCDCLCHNDSFFGKLLYNFVNFFWKLFKIQQGCQCGAQHW